MGNSALGQKLSGWYRAFFRLLKILHNLCTVLWWLAICLRMHYPYTINFQVSHQIPVQDSNILAKHVRKNLKRKQGRQLLICNPAAKRTSYKDINTVAARSYLSLMIPCVIQVFEIFLKEIEELLHNSTTANIVSKSYQCFLVNTYTNESLSI